jgi:radical SAM protein with 4Fe4S-binding SPASM domain
MRKADYDLITKNISNLVHLRHELRVNGPIIQTIFHTMPENAHEEKKYLKFWRGKVDHVRHGGSISLAYSEYGTETQSINPREATCVNLWERMTIFWNGDVSLCPKDVDGNWVHGNLSESTIYELWNHDRFETLRSIHMEKRFQEFPFCYNCDME